ncbi:MAG: type II toxin-antitoxin system HicB family antitoxin [Methylococcaceae bacterium]|jgi:predicted HicB family RNase H-like nuclease
MIYKNYEAQISFSEEDEIFFGRVVNIERDIIAFDGCSVQELKQSFHLAIEEYLQDCKDTGKKPENPILTSQSQQAFDYGNWSPTR